MWKLGNNKWDLCIRKKGTGTDADQMKRFRKRIDRWEKNERDVEQKNNRCVKKMRQIWKKWDRFETKMTQMWIKKWHKCMWNKKIAEQKLDRCETKIPPIWNKNVTDISMAATNTSQTISLSFSCLCDKHSTGHQSIFLLSLWQTQHRPSVYHYLVSMMHFFALLRIQCTVYR